MFEDFSCRIDDLVVNIPCAQREHKNTMADIWRKFCWHLITLHLSSKTLRMIAFVVDNDKNITGLILSVQ